MGKIVFTKRDDGCLVASDRELYQSSMISGPDFDLGVEIAVAAKDNTTTVFSVLEKNRQQNVLYAVDHKTKKITRAAIVRLDDDSVKFMFDDDTAGGTRVYVQDGDMVFTSREEALEEVTGVVKNHEDVATDDKADTLSALMNRFMTAIKDARRQKATEENKDDRSVINEHIEHREPTEEEKMETAKASIKLSTSLRIAKLAARRLMLLDMINDIDTEMAALNQFSKMNDEGNITFINPNEDDDD